MKKYNIALLGIIASITLANTPMTAHADTLNTNVVIASSSITNDDPIITTDEDTVYNQLLATQANIQSQISKLSDATTKKQKSLKDSLTVQQLNIDSQIQVVKTKLEREAKAKAEQEAKAKAEQEAKVKAEQEAKAKAEQEAKAKAEQDAKDKVIADAKAAQAANPTVQATQISDNPIRNQLVEKAKSLIGTPYVWGGTNPATGLDCSGFTSYVYNQVTGINTGRTTWNQDAVGQHIDLSAMQPGDLILENDKEHIAMYLGDGLQIDAPQPGESVSIRSVSSAAMYGLKFID